MSEGSVGLQQFGSIYLAGQSSGSGTLKIGDEQLAWRAREGSRQENVDKSDLVRIEWVCGARGRQLRCVLKGGLSVRFEGFKESDFSRIDDYIRRTGLLKEGRGLVRAKQAAKGWNWGDLDVKGSSLTFKNGDEDVLDISLSDVAQVDLNASDEVSLAFHLDDTAGPNDESLVEMRFRVTDLMKAKEVHEKIRHRADTSAFAGESLATFNEVPVIVPRGRFDVDLYPNYFKMQGKSYDFKVLYSSVSRLFLLPKPDEIHVSVVVSVDPPIRQGNTHYPHIVFQFLTEDEVDVSVRLSEEELEKKYGGKISQHEKGESWKVFSKIVKALSGKSLHAPKKFLSAHDQRAVRTSLGANEGYLFFLESCFFFVNKPPMYIRYDDVNVVKFRRMDLERRFDLLICTSQGQNSLFSNIDRPEFDKIYEFLSSKEVPMESPKEKQPQPGAISMAQDDDDDESEDEDFDPEAKPKKGDDAPSDSDENMDSDEIPEDEVFPEDDSEEDKPPKKKSKE